jgi:hypothetical protein
MRSSEPCPRRKAASTPTCSESRKPGEAPFLLELLADDAARIAEAEPLSRSIPTKRLAIPAAVAGVAFASLVGLLFIGGSVGEGARHLWLGKLPTASRIAVAAGGIAVRPGDVSVRRNQDLAISALVAGGARDAQLHVKFGDGDWETAPMVAGNDGGHSFTLFAVRDGARYYVSAGSLKSREHKIDVVDLPRIESLRLTYLSVVDGLASRCRKRPVTSAQSRARSDARGAHRRRRPRR